MYICSPNFVNMKKIIFFVTSLLCLTCWSCQDESGDYIDQLFTNADLTSAARSCLNVAKDTAVAHLCGSDLLSASADYRIELPENSQFYALRDSLVDGAILLDTLENQVNRACEKLGGEVTNVFKNKISALTFDDPSSLIYGSDNALTAYLQIYCETEFQNSLMPALNTQLAATGASATFNQILTRYFNTTGTPFVFDLSAYVMRNFTPSIFKEMEKEEKLIRHNASHRVTSSLENVFAN